MIRDAALLAHSLLHAGASVDCGNSHQYWDQAPEDELTKIVKRLSNPEDKERALIRNIILETGSLTVLDVACGPTTEKTGYDRYDLPVSYTGIDASESMLRVARQRHPESRLVRAKAQEIPFADNAFDAVLLKHILEHLPRYEEAIEESVRVAKNMVIINFFHRLMPIAQDLHLCDRRGFHNNWYSKSRFCSYLESLPITRYDTHQTKGTAGQTADIYILHKIRKT
ncbi:class I SAM-dependent methyltransferase [Candidatus Woesearchaeota archaeon]|nr:class I SAM-dependent methyltransferase [Candidatus Woesearchaeota archaeon]